MDSKELVLPDKVKKAVGDRKVLGFVSGIGLFKKLTGTIIVTESGIVFYDPKLTGAHKTEIPFAQILSAQYMIEMGTCSFSVTTQSGANKLTLSAGSKKGVHEPALALFNLVREKLSEMAAVPISETHNKGIMKETWSFYAPPQLAVMQSDSKLKESEEDIPGKLQKLSELHKAGVLSSNEFESKKAELLKRF